MRKNYSLSVIILNYNTYDLTCNCIRSLLKSDLEGIKLEIILVDNGSTERQPIPFTTVFPEVVYVVSSVNLGFAKGNNLGISKATGSYILLLNSDTILNEQDVLIKSLKKLTEFGDKVVLTSKLLTPQNVPQVAYGCLPSLSTEMLFTTFIYKLLPKLTRERLLIDFAPEKNRLFVNGYITATYFLFEKNALDKLSLKKLYDDLFLYGEELFWATQFNSAGYQMYYYADVAIIHLVGASDETSSKVLRRTYQTKGEHAYLVWRYNAFTRFWIYAFRIVRFLILSPMDKDIRLRLILLLKLLLHKL
jgi:GT2 family glycosyltransferase